MGSTVEGGGGGEALPKLVLGIILILFRGEILLCRVFSYGKF